MADLPNTVYVQLGQLDGHDLFINRTADGALNRILGAGFQPGINVGVYKLERIVKLQLKVVEVNDPVSTSDSPPSEIPPATN